MRKAFPKLRIIKISLRGMAARKLSRKSHISERRSPYFLVLSINLSAIRPQFQRFHVQYCHKTEISCATVSDLSSLSRGKRSLVLMVSRYPLRRNGLIHKRSHRPMAPDISSGLYSRSCPGSSVFGHDSRMKSKVRRIKSTIKPASMGPINA
jgi:hypothetical protein